MKKLHCALCILVFSLSLATAFFLNVVPIIKQVVAVTPPEEIKAQIESYLGENVYGKEMFTEVYGLTHQLLALDVLGSFEYVRDDAGIMQFIEPAFDPAPFLDSMKELKCVLNQKGIPLLFVELPDRGKYFDFRGALHYSGESLPELTEALESSEIDVLKIADQIKLDSLRMYREYFFPTDVHSTTKAEYCSAKLITDYLSKAYSVPFPMSDVMYNPANWEWSQQEWLGGFGRLGGRSFSGADTFTTFLPNFETQMRLTVPEAGIVKMGDFYEVMTSGYEASGSEDAYWVINYGQWPQPVYTYQNLFLEEGPRLLVICDSFALRTNTFLAMNASVLTVLDPRYFNDKDYLAEYLSMDSYDAVIVLGGSSGFYQSHFVSDFGLDKLEVKGGQIEGYSGMYINFCNNIWLNDQGVIPFILIEGSHELSLSGWAADFSSAKPLSALYVKAGEMILKCDYGAPRGDIASYFNNQDFLNTGFSVKIPKDFLLAQNVAEIQFIEVSTDGSYRFEPISYAIQP